MKNMNDKAKKRLIVAGGILISVVLIFMIGTRLQPNPVKDASVTAPTNGTDKVVVDGSKTESTEKKEVKVPAIVTTPQPKAETGGDDTGTEQTIQTNIPEKPTYTEEQLKDPTQKPSGEKVDLPKDNKSSTKVTTQETKTSKEPQGGDTKNGQIYLPGFGWVKDEGGGGEGTTAGDMYENGNKIGNMN